ncbi:hypothetical protein Bpfe_007407 [Biomphalaria pfeifferi]|uniref:Uncharacterized protein n=1 Tax=Biomphalaria pfeifferi TaxID=112525 RepID=A0AAD8BYT4_BIOPF|nr:hypothetical protein Bpfe_007407 [Biomphalaria pfeifferi]
MLNAIPADLAATTQTSRHNRVYSSTPVCLSPHICFHYADPSPAPFSANGISAPCKYHVKIAHGPVSARIVSRTCWL